MSAQHDTFRKPVAVTAGFDPLRWRRDFPILQRQMRGKPLVYLDNAATSQKPQAVIDAITNYYEKLNSNVHRGVHQLSEMATAAYEGSREKIRQFINAASTKEIVFVRGATEAINLVAQSYGRGRFQAGDEIILSEMEHHSNIVPWQLLCEQMGAVLRVIPITATGELQPGAYEKLFTSRTRLVALGHVSNALGTINPVKEMIAFAHARRRAGITGWRPGGAAYACRCARIWIVIFTSSPATRCSRPTGIGVLYGKEALLETCRPGRVAAI